MSWKVRVLNTEAFWSWLLRVSDHFSKGKGFNTVLVRGCDWEGKYKKTSRLKIVKNCDHKFIESSSEGQIAEKNPTRVLVSAMFFGCWGCFWMLEMFLDIGDVFGYWGCFSDVTEIFPAICPLESSIRTASVKECMQQYYFLYISNKYFV